MNEPTQGKLILISDIIETRLRKEKEIEYYQKQLEKIQQKMLFLQKDLDITNLIIDMIEKEKVIGNQNFLIQTNLFFRMLRKMGIGNLQK